MAGLVNKRKRDTADIPHPRPGPGMSAADFDQHYLQHHDDDGIDHHENMDFAAALAQHNADLGETPDAPHDHGPNQGQQDHHHHHHHPHHDPSVHNPSDTAAAAMAQYHTMTVPQSTEATFLAQQNNADEPPGPAPMGESRQHPQPNFGDFDMNSLKDTHHPSDGAASPSGPNSGNPNSTPKPQVGTEEWHKVRRDNHKEVERRRRETINEGINELSKIVPGCEKNKGSILARAVQFITQLKENETQNIEKWTLEKLLTEQALAELSSSCDKLKAECQRAWAECEQWKKAAQKVGVAPDLDDVHRHPHHDPKGE